MLGSGRVVGITPIYMGSTKDESQRRRRGRDHPHIHGEHRSRFKKALAPAGSPPYTWGALRWGATPASSVRITPIYMGSTPRFVTVFAVPWDHPHIHGEHPSMYFYIVQTIGSPPYTWGALLKNEDIEIWIGITPIYMGSTSFGLPEGKRTRDHPHIHGEHLPKIPA